MPQYKDKGHDRTTTDNEPEIDMLLKIILYLIPTSKRLLSIFNDLCIAGDKISRRKQITCENIRIDTYYLKP